MEICNKSLFLFGENFSYMETQSHNLWLFSHFGDFLFLASMAKMTLASARKVLTHSGDENQNSSKILVANL